MRIENFNAHHADVVMNSLNQDRKDAAKYCDFRIIVNGYIFPVHKSVVGPLSDFFDSMFFSEMRETYEHQVIIDTISKDVMELVVEFFYTSKIQITSNNVYDIMEAANYLNLQNVKQFCTNFLLNEVEPENCFKLKKISKLYDCQTLTRKIDSVIERHFETVLSSKEFLTLDVDEVKSLLNLKKKKVSSEDRVYDAIIGWVKNDVSSRSTHIGELFSAINLSVVSWDFLNQVIIKEHLITESLECMKVLVQAMAIHTRVNSVSEKSKHEKELDVEDELPTCMYESVPDECLPMTNDVYENLFCFAEAEASSESALPEKLQKNYDLTPITSNLKSDAVSIQDVLKRPKSQLDLNQQKILNKEEMQPSVEKQKVSSAAYRFEKAPEACVNLSEKCSSRKKSASQYPLKETVTKNSPGRKIFIPTKDKKMQTNNDEKISSTVFEFFSKK